MHLAQRLRAFVALILKGPVLFQLSKLARDLKPSDEFNISQQHTELRLLSNDIAKLHIDETKTTEPPPRQRLELDEDEDNPLGSDENAGGLEVSETVQVSETSSEKPSEAGTINDDVVTTNDERSPNLDAVENNGESESKENVTEEGPGDEDDDFEGGLC